MSLQHSSRFCRECQKRVLAQRPGTNHGLHLVLTIVTGGAWLLIWILVAVKIGGWRCAFCGSRV